MMCKRKIIAWITVLCMAAAMFPNFGAFAAERVTYLLDTSKKSAITNAGFTADSKKVNTTKYSAKWETVIRRNFI